MTHVRNPRNDVTWLAMIILVGICIAVVMGACGDDLRPPPVYIIDASVVADAPGPDAEPQLTPDTWYHAYLDWEQIDCEHTRRCDYETLEILFDGSVPDCVEYLAQQDCNAIDPLHGPVNCTTVYPKNRWPLLDQCRDEVRTIACGLNPPASCEEALTP